MQFILRLIFAAGFLFLLTCCQKKDEGLSSQETKTQKAIQLTEKGLYSEALEILQEEQSINPSERVQTLIASTYAARAGVKVENYWGFVVGYESLFGTKKSKPGAFDGLPPEVLTALKDLKGQLELLQAIQGRIELIPYVTEVQRDDVLLAQEALQGTTSAGARLYRAILAIIVLRSTIPEGAKVFDQLSKDAKICAQNFSLASDWFTFNYEMLEGLLSDLEVAFPSQKTEIIKIKGQIKSNPLTVGQVCRK